MKNINAESRRILYALKFEFILTLQYMVSTLKCNCLSVSPQWIFDRMVTAKGS